MIRAGVTPITWMLYMLEIQRDWANQETYDAVFYLLLKNMVEHTD